MTKVFLHGNPETAAIWQPLAIELERLGVSDVLFLSPPGFGAPTPPHWAATQSDYTDWLIEEVERIDAPVDIVGHDWVQATFMARLHSAPISLPVG